MSIATAVYSGPYTGTGAQTAFPFSFTAIKSGDVLVKVNDVEISSALYTVTLALDYNSGTVTFGTAPASGASVLVLQNPDFLQDSQFANQAAYSMSSVNQINRRATQRSNWLFERMKVLFSSSMLTSADRADKYLGWDSSGNPVAKLGNAEAAAASAVAAEASAATAAASAVAATNASNLTSGTVPDARMPALTGDVTTTIGTVATTIASGAVTNAKLANVATATFKGRTAAGAGSPEDLTGTQATALLDTFTSALKGLAPASGGGTTNFLRADGVWAAPPGGGGGTTTNALTMNNGGAGAASGTTFDGSVARTISYNTIGATRAGAITSGDLTIASARLAGRTTAATGAVEEISVGSNLSLSAGTLNLATSPAITTPTVTGGTITPAATPTATDPGFIGLPQVSKTASYTLTMADMFKEIYITGTTAAQTITIPANGSVAAPIGAFVTITNDSNQNWSIAITTDTLALSPGGTTGTRTLAANGTATIRKVTSTRWWIYGTGLT